jgi:predicted mannosyl-3-phosphoglycerate phosphatase (HAD superfamily)
MISLNKVEYLNNKYGNVIFDYIGDSKKDIPIWEVARTAYVVENKNILNHIRHINYHVIS